MANKRITDVDYLESLNSDESFFINRNNSIKQIKRDNIIFDIINGGTGATNAPEARENLGAVSSVEFEEFKNVVNQNYSDISGDLVGVSDSLAGINSNIIVLRQEFYKHMSNIILSSDQYGDTLPEAGTVGRIFFKKV